VLFEINLYFAQFDFRWSFEETSQAPGFFFNLRTCGLGEILNVLLRIKAPNLEQDFHHGSHRPL